MSVYSGLACAALACACSSEPKVGSTATALDFCKTLGEIAAEKGGECESTAPVFIDAEKAQSNARCSGVQAEVDAGRAVYDRAKGGSCALTLASLDGCAALSVLVGNLPADCTAALTGAVAPGGQRDRAVERRSKVTQRAFGLPFPAASPCATY